MIHKQILLSRSLFAIILVLSTSHARVWGNPWTEMLRSLPAEANAVAIIDLEQFRQPDQSRATEKELAPIVERINDLIPPTIRRMVMAASVDIDTLEPEWEVSVGNITKSRSLEDIAKNQDGYVDDIDGEKVVWSRKGFYLRMVDPSKIGMLRPANRRVLSKWMHNTSSLPLAPAVMEAVERPHDRDALFLALDLTDVISRRAVRDRLEASSLPGLDERDFDRAADDLSSIRLISLSASIERGLRGRCVIDFSRKPTLSADTLKTILIEVLDRRGASLPDLTSWKPRLEESSLILTGPLSPSGMEDIISFLASPTTLAHQERASSYAEESASYSADEKTLRSTKTYFHSVTKIVDKLRDSSPKSQGQRAMWNDRYARQIDELPILSVDSAMIDYGTNVASLLRGSGRVIREANMEVGSNKARSSIQYYGVYAVNDNAPYNAQLQAQARAKGNSAYLENLQQIDNMTATIRREMTMKYNVEF